MQTIYFGEKMRKLIKIVPLLVVIFLVSMSFACASNTDEQILANDTDTPDNEILSVDNDLTNINGQTDANKLTDNEKRITSKTFGELRNEIKSAEEGSTLVLLNDCSCESGFSSDGIGIQKQLTIDGNGHTINGKNTARTFFIDADNVVLKNIIFTNGNSKGNSGGVLLIRASNTVIENCTFKNSKDVYGGAIYITEKTKVDNKALTGTKINNCKFESNTAEKGGGAIYALGKGNTITNSKFTSNKADGMGGAVQIANNNNKIINNTFTSNSAKTEAGALALMYCSNQEIEGNTFTKNTAGSIAGAIDLYKGSGYTVKNNKFDGNTAGDLGGAMRLSISSYSTASRIENNDFKNSQAKNGGAIYCDSDKATFTKNTFYNNKATSKSGGAIFINGKSNVISYNSIDKCSAIYKGGAISIENNFNKIKNNDITNCHAGNGGGAIYVMGSGTTISENNIKSNDANSLGGGIQIDGSKTTIHHNVISGNSAKTNGGALFITGNTETITANKFTSDKGNANSGSGGAIKMFGHDAVITGNTFTKNIAKYGASIFITGSNEKIAKNTYTGSTQAKQVTWKHEKQKTKITAPAKTFKKSMKSKNVVITLKSALNKLLASKKITLSVNGKSYAAKTNSKGQATLKITKLTKKGSFKYTVKFNGDSNFNKVSKTGKITIK